jgi:type IV pilus assembly protein PilM
MSKTLIGIDIGSTEIRAVEVAGVNLDGFAIVSKLGTSPLPDGAVSGGRIKKPEEVAVALVSALRMGKIPRYGAVVGFGAPDAAIAKMMLPSSVRPNERISTIQALGRPLSPSFSLEDSVISTSLIEVSPSPEGLPMATIDIAAVFKEELDTIKKVCKLAKITPKAIDLTGAALLRSLTRANPMFGEVGTVVDVGATKTTVATRQGLFLRSLRTTVGGGSDLTRALMTVTGESWEESERRKFTMKLNNSKQVGFDSSYLEQDYVDQRASMVDDALSEAVDILVDTIAQSVEADAANNANYTQGVLLCGGCVLLRGFKDRLQSRIGVPVAIGRPWADIEPNRRNASYFSEGKIDPRVLLKVAPAVGLALWREPT